MHARSGHGFSGAFSDFYPQITRWLEGSAPPPPPPPPPDDDHGNNCSGATRVALPSTTGGSLERGQDLDYFRFSVSRGPESCGRRPREPPIPTGRCSRREGDRSPRTTTPERTTTSGSPRTYSRGSIASRCGAIAGLRREDYSLKVEFSASTPPPPPPPPAAAAITRFGDLNGDGRDDVLVRNTSGRWYYYAMNGRKSHWRNERQRTSDQRYKVAARRHRRSQRRPARRRARAPHLRALVLLRHERAQPHWRNERQRAPDQRFELAARRHRRFQRRRARRRARAPHLRALVLLRHERAQSHWAERAAARA